MPGVALFAVLPLNVHDGARRFGFKHRIHRWQNGEHQGLKEDDGLNAEPAKIPRLLRRNPLHSYAVRVFRVPPKGTPDQVLEAAFGGGTSQVGGPSAPGGCRGSRNG